VDLDLISAPSLPESDKRRGAQQGLRSRMLTGQWESDLETALGKHIAADRRPAWGIVELSRNPFRSLSSQVGGALYAAPPVVRGPTGSEPLVDAVAQAGLWQLMQRVSTDLVGIREGIVRVDYSERGGLLFRPAPVNMCVVRSRYDAPDVPVALEEIQCRDDPDTGKPAWAWEILDVTDLNNPIHKIVSAKRDKDWTEAILGGPKSSAKYQYREASGRPFLPAVMYHAERTGQLWDSHYGVEAVLGTLTVGVLLTFWVHGVKDGSFATVLLVGGKIVGLEVRSPSGERTQVISAEPGSLIEVAPADEYSGQVQAVQLQPGFDPENLMRAIGSFEAGLAEYAGVSPADLVRTGADPRSGASLSISREGLRASQARYEPQLRRGDLEVIAVAAKVINAATGSKHPEGGYSISYPSLPLSGEERRAQREDILAKVGAGLKSKVDAFIDLYPGLSREQAKIELRRIEQDNREFSDVPMVVVEVPATGAPAADAPKAPAIGDAPVAAPETPAANTAFNVAQVQAAQGIIVAVATGQLPRASAIQMLVEFFNLAPDAAERVMGTVGNGFTPAAPTEEVAV
jgi:hypothetical protein